MRTSNERPPFEEVESVPKKAYRIEFNTVVYVDANHVSPQQIEDAIIVTIGELNAFGYVKNISVTRSDEDGD